MKNSYSLFQAEPLQNGLYIVATPIGNLRDISIRALSTLASVKLIACEDTRVSRKLLDHYGINTQTLSYHDHNAERIRPELLQRMREGEAIALISDAGTPLISDPGYKLVREAQNAGIFVTAIPGASSVLHGLCVSGLPTDRFLFLGFLPVGAQRARTFIESYQRVSATLILFESAKRIAKTLNLLAETLGAREAAVTRELTKLYEEVRRGSLAELAAHYAGYGDPKGEVVLVIAPPEEKPLDVGTLDAMLTHALARLPLKEAVAEIAQSMQLPRNQVYARALELRDER